YRWGKTFGSTFDDLVSRVAVDGAGNIYAAGAFSETVDFSGAGDGGLSTLTSNGSNDVFLLKLDASGKFLWVEGFGGIIEDRARGLTTDKAGNVTLTGDFGYQIDLTGEIDAGGTDGGIGKHMGDAGDGYVVRYSPDGKYQWSWVFSGDQYQSGTALATDPCS